MKKYRSPLHIFGFILMLISTIAFIVSMILCYIEKIEGIIYAFVSLILFLIALKCYNKGKIKTESHYGNDSTNRNEDENIYKDTQKKD